MVNKQFDFHQWLKPVKQVKPQSVRLCDGTRMLTGRFIVSKVKKTG